MRFRDNVNSAYTRLLNARAALQSLPGKALDIACTIASFRGPNELPFVRGVDDGPFVPVTDAVCVELAVARGKLMASAVRRVM